MRCFSKSISMNIGKSSSREFMAGLPVLASDLPAVNKVYQEFPFGVLAPSTSSPIELAEHLKKLLDNIDSYKPILKNAAQKYNYENQTQIVQDIFVNQ